MGLIVTTTLSSAGTAPAVGVVMSAPAATPAATRHFKGFMTDISKYPLGGSQGRHPDWRRADL